MKPSDGSRRGQPLSSLLAGLVALGSMSLVVSDGRASAVVTRDQTTLPSGAGRTLGRLELAPTLSGPAAALQVLEKGLARPTSLAAADLDEDGTLDLIAGYDALGAGIFSVHLGNTDAIYPNSPEAGERRARGTFTASPFLSPARLTEVPQAVDFLVAGDFDADDHQDVLAGASREGVLYFFQGNGRGGFAPPDGIEVAGTITSVTAGEMGRPDGLPALVVGVDGDEGARVLVFDSTAGALRVRPESFPLPGRAASLLLGHLDGDDWNDLAVAIGNDLWMLRGSDRGSVSAGSGESSLVPLLLGEPAALSSVRCIALGDFDGDGRADLAQLTSDGAVLVGAVPRAWPETRPERPSEVARVASGEGLGRNLLFRARASGRSGDDLVLLDDAGRRLTVLSGPERGAPRPDRAVGAGGPDGAVIRSWFTISLGGQPVAALPMRLNGDSMDDLVILQDAPNLLSVAAPMPEAAIIVTNTSDAGAGSLRQAILTANTTSAADTLSFNLPGSGPFVIQPLSPLPTITFPVTIDATTQPGFAGTPLVQIDGSLAGNGAHGLVLSGGSSTVRGLVIGRFGGTGAGDGIHVQGAGGNVIENNYIGTDLAGTAARANTGSGVVIDNVAGNTIGSTVAAGRNLLSGNAGSGVVIMGSSATTNIVEGNFIGTRAGGGAALGNGARGVLVDGAPGNTIGISNVLPNIISGNSADGLLVNGAAATGNLVRGNYIGTDATAMAAVRNTVSGLRILSSNTTVGGSTIGQRNTIAFNGADGVTVGSGSGNRLMRNLIFSNSALGVDLGADGVTPNDSGDADTGANGLQNAPVLTSAITDSSSSTIAGTFNSRPGASYTIEFFSSPTCDPSGFGEGRQYFMGATLTTDAAGNAAFNLNQPLPLPVSSFLTVTASDSGANTSEFSNCIRVSDQTPAEVSSESWSGTTQVSWTAVAGATSYNLYRGQAPFLPNLVNSAQESCLRQSVTSPTTGNTLTETPDAGSVYWYLIAGVNSFGEGTEGDATTGPRVLDSFGNCPTCAHEKCVAGGPLSSGCDPCVASICASTPSCCSTQWTGTCVDKVLSVCGSLQCAASAGACPHPQCVTGGALAGGCDSPPVSPSCAAAVCAADAACCSSTWDSTCVEEVGTVCAKTCN